jgi:hypothetical protein
MQMDGRETYGLLADYLAGELKYSYYDYIKDDEYLNKIESHINDISRKHNLTKLKVSIVTTNVPLAWIVALSNAGCKVDVIGYHPLLLSNKELICSFNNVSIIEKNIFVDDLNSSLKQSKVIIFPDFEFYIPLSLCKANLKNKDVMVVSCFKDIQGSDGLGITPNIVSTKQQFEQNVSFEYFNKKQNKIEHLKYHDYDYFYYFGKQISSVSFFTMKWGTKYGPEYVNKLFDQLERTYSDHFEFYCVTDDPSQLYDNINILTFEDIEYQHSPCFTVQKLFLFKKGLLSDKLNIQGPYVLLDIDSLVLKDLKPYFEQYQFSEGRMIKNFWDEIEGGQHLSFFGSCWVNSSFVTWKEDQLDYLYQYFIDHKDIIEWKYEDLDFFLFNTIPHQIKYHPEKIVYAYNFGAYYPDDMEKYKYRPDYYISIFNTSHGEGFELHEANGWVKEFWT